MRGYHYIYVVLCMMLLGVVMPESVMAQYYPERKLVREGNELFEGRNFRRSLNNYNAALDHDSTNYEALYNRANAYYHATLNKAEDDATFDFKTSNALYEQVAADTLLSDVQRAEILRNLGESLFTQQEYEAALNSFRESLRLNPDDKEVKYDYVLTKRIVDQKRAVENQNQNQNQDQNQNNEGNNDQNQNQDGEGDNNQNSENNQNPNQKEDNKDNGGQDENQGDDNQQEQNGGNDDQQEKGDQREQDGSPQPKELSPEKERMLDAIQAQEDKTQEKLNDDKKRGVIIPGKKNW